MRSDSEAKEAVFLSKCSVIRFKLTEIMGAMSNRGLARTAKVDYKTVDWLKSGRQTGISFDVLDRLCKALNCDPGALFEQVDESPVTSPPSDEV